MRTVTFAELQERHPRLFANAPWSNCPTGWLPLLDKYAELRVYLVNETASAEALVSEYERRSAKTCERCGAPGKQSSRVGWLVVRCEEHTP